MSNALPGIDNKLVDTVVAMHLAEVAEQMKDAARRCKAGARNRAKNGDTAQHVRDAENLAEAFVHAEMELLQRAHEHLGSWDNGVCKAPPIRIVAR